METRQRIAHVERSSPSVSKAADAFLATVRTEHARVLEVISRASAGLGSEAGQLAVASAGQAQLTRQFFDAQRSILRQRAEADAELADIGSVPSADATQHAAAHEDDLLSTQRQQLSALLDEWWTAECRVRQTVICEAREAVQQYLARLTVGEDHSITLVDAATVQVPSAEPTLPARTSLILDQLETADVGDLQSLLEALIESLDAQPAVRDVTGDLHFVEVAASDEFGQFWTRAAPAPANPRRRWSIPHGVVPVAAAASLLTIAMAWIG
jgi:hypothetical protein